MQDRLIGGGSVLAAVEVPAGRLELVGVAEPWALCLQDRSGARSCGARHAWPSLINCCPFTGPDPLLVSARLGATWYVFAASRQPIELSAINPDHGRVQASSDRGWNFGLLDVPEGSLSVEVRMDGGRFGVGDAPS